MTNTTIGVPGFCCFTSAGPLVHQIVVSLADTILRSFKDFLPLSEIQTIRREDNSDDFREVYLRMLCGSKQSNFFLGVLGCRLKHDLM